MSFLIAKEKKIINVLYFVIHLTSVKDQDAENYSSRQAISLASLCTDFKYHDLV